MGLHVRVQQPVPPGTTRTLHNFGIHVLSEAAEATIRATAKRLAPRRARTARGGTLRSGPRTPLWNEVVTAVRPSLARRGTKAKLARLLGVPRQRVHLIEGREAGRGSFQPEQNVTY